MKRLVIGTATAVWMTAALAAAQATQQQTTPPPTQQTPPPTQQQTPPPPPTQTTPPPQQQTPPPTQTPPPGSQTGKTSGVPETVTLVGCVARGTSANVYLFENALDPALKDQQPRAFRIVSSGEEMDFTPHVAHKVQIVGTIEQVKAMGAAGATATGTTGSTTAGRATGQATVAAGAQLDEKTLPLLTVKSVTPVANTCS